MITNNSFIKTGKKPVGKGEIPEVGSVYRILL